VVTPGPWEINPQGNSVRGPAGFVCSLNDVKPADARLIVAGPDLLHVLRDSLPTLERSATEEARAHRATGIPRTNARDRLAAARAAIAKATEAS
jgi:hypothetical protein